MEQGSMFEGTELGISARREVRRGCQASHLFETYERIIYGKRYIFTAHRSVYGGHAGIVASRQARDGAPTETVLTIGEDMPKSGW